ncbi:unnamed protein product [Closterium sp. NIES-53]
MFMLSQPTGITKTSTGSTSSHRQQWQQQQQGLPVFLLSSSPFPPFIPSSSPCPKASPSPFPPSSPSTVTRYRSPSSLILDPRYHSQLIIIDPPHPPPPHIKTLQRHHHRHPSHHPSQRPPPLCQSIGPQSRQSPAPPGTNLNSLSLPAATAHPSPPITTPQKRHHRHPSHHPSQRPPPLCQSTYHQTPPSPAPLCTPR